MCIISLKFRVLISFGDDGHYVVRLKLERETYIAEVKADKIVHPVPHIDRISYYFNIET